MHDSQEQAVTWDKVIEPVKPLFSLRLRELWHYRDLLMLLVKRDFVSFYKQTVLGPLWFFIQPFFTTIVYTVIFGNLAKISTDETPKLLFYLSGITAWSYFADCLTKTSTVFRDNANIFGKVYFPRLIMPLSIVVSCLVRFGVQFLLFVVMMIYFAFTKANFHLTWAVALFPVLVLMMATLGLGLGLIITAMTTKYRDLSFLVVFGIQLLMYATPIVYPLSFAPEKYRFWLQLNPMTSIIEAFRYAFLGQGTFSALSLGYSAGASLLILFAGIIIFNKTEKNFVDTI